MVKPVSIGIIGIQGAVSEHCSLLNRLNTLSDEKRCKVSVIRQKTQLNKVQGIIIPGGESSTISRFLQQKGLAEEIKRRVKDRSLAVMGTCAGCVILASQLVHKDKEVTLLGLMDMEVERNAFGRQRESFEDKIDINGIGSSFPAVFIRAPMITSVWGRCKLLAQVDNFGVMAEQKNLLALSFHPELTIDIRSHQYFLSMVENMIEKQ